MNNSTQLYKWINPRNLLFILLILGSELAQSQLSTKHYLPPMFARVDFISGHHYVYVTNPSNNTVSAGLRDGNGNPIFNSSGNEVTDYNIPPNSTWKIWLGFREGAAGMLARNQLNQVISTDENIIVNASDPVYVQVRHLDDIHGLMYSSKGEWAQGTRFRTGVAFSKNGQGLILGGQRSDFISVMATEDNTSISFREFKAGVDLVDVGDAQDFTVNLNAGDSYTISSFPRNSDNMFLSGTLVVSDNPIVVNCGSWQIDNSDLFGPGRGDIAADQIIPMNRLDTEYILMNVDGSDDAEKVMIVADQNGTQYFINGNATAAGTLNAGQFALINRNSFSILDNMYIRSNLPVAIYQTTGLEDFSSGFSIITPLKCWGTTSTVIPAIESDFDLGLSRINIVAKKNTSISVIGGDISNGSRVPGNTTYETFKVTPTTDADIYISSDKNIQIGTSYRKESLGAATYYSEYFESDTLLIAELCTGQSFSMGSSTYSETGVYEEVLVNINGCDSIVTLDLLVSTLDTTLLVESICEGESFTFGGSIYSEEGIYYHDLTSANSCDSTVSLNLSFYTNQDVETSTTICEGDLFNGIQINSDTLIEQSFVNSNDCNSILTTYISINPTYSEFRADTICFGERIRIGNEFISQSGQYFEDLQTDLGCDSVIITELHVLPEAVETNFLTLCQGEYFLGVQVFQDTIVDQTLQNSYGCDLFVSNNIQIVDALSSAQEVIQCPGEFFDGIFIQNDTIVIQTLQSSQGCDSIVTSNIIMNSFESLDSIYLNSGEVYNGNSYEEDELVLENLTSINGCDSLAQIQILINPTLISFEEIDLCSGEIYAGQNFYADTTLNFETTAMNGFDSVHIVNLSIHENYFDTIFQHICFGDSLEIDGSYEMETGFYSSINSSFFGCDSIVVTDLFVEEAITNSSEVSICEGESILIDGILQSEEGVYEEIIPLISGCDSIQITTLTLNLVFDLLDTIYVFENQGFESDSLVSEFLSSEMGCDSVQNTQFILLPNFINIDSIDICEGDVYNGQIYLSDTTLIQNLTSSTGSDSTQINVLSILDTIWLYNYTEGCLGDTLYFGNSTITENEVISELVLNQNGCFDKLHYVFDFKENLFLEEEKRVCEGESYFFNGEELITAGIYLDSLVSSTGCDSIISLDFGFIEMEEVQIEGLREYCEGEQLELSLGNFASYEWSNGSTEANILVNSAGTYSVTVTNSDGCLNSANIEIPSANEILFDLEINPPTCIQEFGSVEVLIPLGSDADYEYSLNESELSSSEQLDQLESGSYNLLVQDNIGCSEMVSFTIDEVIDLEISIQGEEMINLGESSQLLVLFNEANIEQITWTPSENLSCSNCLNPLATPQTTTEYAVIVQSEDGCVDSTTFLLRVQEDKNYFIPDAFSPNQDGLNDYFNVYVNSSVEKISYLRIFDRWGNQLFTNQNFEPNIEELGWDGSYKNEYMNPGVYIYSVGLLLKSGEIINEKGDLVLLK